jgi:hypothetical protein
MQFLNSSYATIPDQATQLVLVQRVVELLIVFV